MKQLPDILTSVTFWASVGTLWGAAGAWFTYVAAAISSRKQTHEGVSNFIAGLEAELELTSEWACGNEGNQGYLASKTRLQLVIEHPDWFNPTRRVFKFDAPTIGTLTSSPYARSAGLMVRTFVRLNHSIHRIFENVDYYRTFVTGDLALYQTVVKKLAPEQDPADLASSTTPQTITLVRPHKVAWTPQEHVYINIIFMMNEAIHQSLIGGADSADEGCLYKMFRTAKNQLNDFKATHRTRERLPWWYWILHILAGGFVFSGLWQVLRWYGVWPKGW